MSRLDDPVRSAMSQPVRTVDADRSAEDAAGVLLKEGIGSVVVVDGDPVGILTKTDLIAGIHAGPGSGETPVEELMTPDPITTTPDVSIRMAADTMERNGIKRLPVTDGASVLGIVTTTDLMAAAAADADAADEASAGVFTAAFASGADHIYECTECGARTTADQPSAACPNCGGLVRNITISRG